MKFLAVVFIAFIATALAEITEEQRAKLKGFKEACITESGVDAAVVENAKSGNYAEDDAKLKCFSLCMLKKLDIAKPDGTLDEAAARAKLPSNIDKTKSEEAITKCKAIAAGATACDTGADVLKCLHQNHLSQL